MEISDLPMYLTVVVVVLGPLGIALWLALWSLSAAVIWQASQLRRPGAADLMRGLLRVQAMVWLTLLLLYVMELANDLYVWRYVDHYGTGLTFVYGLRGYIGIAVMALCSLPWFAGWLALLDWIGPRPRRRFAALEIGMLASAPAGMYIAGILVSLLAFRHWW
jgi:hypothetical protein